MNKKGMSHIDMMVLLVLGLLVLAVAASIYFKQSGKADVALNDCESKLGSCQYATSGDCVKEDGLPMPAFDCYKDGKKDKDKTCCYLRNK